MPLLIALVITIVTIIIIICIRNKKYQALETEVLNVLGFSSWDIIPYIDDNVVVKSRQSLENYDAAKYFREHSGTLSLAKTQIQTKNETAYILSGFLEENEFKKRSQYSKIVAHICTAINNAGAYRICITYISSAGNQLGTKVISLTQQEIKRFEKDPTLLMTKSEYNRYLKEQEQEAVIQKQHQYYEKVNKIIDHASKQKNALIIDGSSEQIDSLIAQLFDRTVNSIKRIKRLDSEEWSIIQKFIRQIENEVNIVIDNNQRILAYYESDSFQRIKNTCEILMSSQREFNEYITEKVESIASLLGSRVIRNETVHEDEYQYIRPYQKNISPFTVEVSAAVFASAENSPLDYVIKNFYPNKELYPEQIQKLQLLIEELATLREAKQIIENYKVEYQQYLADVPSFILESDETGFYSRLGFANIDEKIFAIEYRFSYTSGGGMAKRTFAIPMTEDTIIELIKGLEGRLTSKAFTKEQRALMTNKLRESIKIRDNYTCCHCGNSTHSEPNLLLEIDHIIPVSKGGFTVEDNLQTLCWKCNRAKSNKLAN